MSRRFGWLWAAYAVSTLGTFLAFDAFPLIAILVLHSGPAAVSLMAAAGLAMGAALGVPLGPWVEFRRKRRVMMAMDLVRFGALVSVPVAYALDALTFVQLLAVAVVCGAADIAFRAASGAFLRGLVPPDQLLRANGRFESTLWTATALGPPLGGAAIGIFGTMVTVVVNAVSFLLSALGLRAVGGDEPAPAPRPALCRGDVLAGWRTILGSPSLRPLFLNTVLVNGLIMATAPLLAVLMLRDLDFAPWQYGLAFSVPCLGGLLGSRVAARAVARWGRDRVLAGFGSARACWSIGLALVGPGVPGLLLVMAIELGMIACIGVFNPVFATYRLEQTPADRTARVLSAWTAASNATIALLTATWGLLAAAMSPRLAIAAAGALMVATPLLLVRSRQAPSAATAPTPPPRPRSARPAPAAR